MNKPIHKIKAGAVTATIWKNLLKKDEEEYVSYSTNIEKNYKDKEGNWKTTNSFGENDIPKAELVAREAFLKIQEFKNGESND